ncbi:DUF397 domain-containing protein [Streptomyces sp. WZ-12]|uniref:DUF397 domain-containing protein n=1 Tax=Streptomyces sp. WZ-12 TaxID=3030210 RepID=UPI0023818BE0|nr:DUF397 domain-containing protein [Streptomyces sp. WZ-12]
MNIDLTWRKSSYSGSEGGECVEVATGPAASCVHIRDSKDATGPHLTLGPVAWVAFVRYAAEVVPVRR